jgi:hypothetical protein
MYCTTCFYPTIEGISVRVMYLRTDENRPRWRPRLGSAAATPAAN